MIAGQSFQRPTATAEVAAKSLAAAYAFDVRADLSRVTAPTPVVHRRGDRAIHPALGQEVAAAIPGAAFAAVEGHEHFPWRGDAPAIQRTVLEFIGAPAVEPPVELAALSDRERDVLGLVAQVWPTGRSLAGSA